MTFQEKEKNTNTFQKFDHQIGGHDRLLSVNDGFVVIKPCNDIEKEFYEHSVLHPDFAKWIPTYYGSLQLQGIQSTVTADITSNEQKTIEDFVQSVKEEISPQHVNVTGAICIKNLLFSFKKPCIMDLKLGTQLWGEDADEPKRQKMIQKAKITTSSSIGIRIVGFQVYQRSTDSYFNYTKEESYSATPDTVQSIFANFFTAEISNDHRRLIIKRFLSDLETFFKVLENQELRLYSSSLFFVYEGDSDALTEAIKKEQDELKEIKGIKMIDFAHSFFRKGIGKDEGALFGLRNTINYFKGLSIKENL
ncbi:5756_t:CDS:2 [Funneliformis geosporum]|uniref:Kinase n=1 Tax=Funneliformis geosporum TaxID=1117311 RepID=A0A9W4SEB5_9GLOM|nr:5756_t:CDS:2 [Funneliformis geosporum]CAI2166261.1 2958_t:CDS:2 [Funneliformis geosporum]